MSGETWTTTDLLLAIRDEGRIPADDTDATDASLLLVTDRIIKRVFMPEVRKARADYYLTYADQTIAQGRTHYPIPGRAMGNTVRSVIWIDSSGREREIPPVAFSDRFLYTQAYGVPTVYEIEDDQVVILPTPSGAVGTLRLYYEYRPGKLVLPAVCSLMATYTPTNQQLNVITGDTVPATITTTTPTDFVLSHSPFSVIATDLTPSATNILLFPYIRYVGSTLPERLTQLINTASPIPGLYVALAGETPVPQVPAELHPALAQFVAAQYLLPIDPEASAALGASAQAALSGALGMLSPRQIGRQQKFHTRSSMMRRGRRRGRGFLGTF